MNVPKNSSQSYGGEFDAVAGKAYQVQFDDPSDVSLFWQSVALQFVPALLADESARTDPKRVAVDRLDSSGNLTGYLGGW